MSDIEKKVDLNKSFERLLVLSEDDNFSDLSSDDEEFLVVEKIRK